MNHNMYKVNRNELLVYTAIFLYCAALFLKRTSVPFDQNILNKVMTCSAMLSLLNIFFDSKMTLRQWLLSFVLGALFFIDSLPTGNHEILYLFILIWSCRNVEKESLMKYIFLIVVVMTLLLGMFTAAGFVDNEVSVQGNERVRYGLGYNVWSILPFQLYSICMFYVYFAKKKVQLYTIFLMLLLSAVIGVLTSTKTSFLLSSIGLLIMYFFQKRKIRHWNRLKWMTMIPTILTVCSFAMTILYANGNALLNKLNIILNYRLTYQSIGLKEYGIDIFANPDMKSVIDEADYFGIDNQFMNLAVTWGIIALIIVVLIYSYLIRYCILNENIKLLIIVIAMMLMAMMWSRLLVLIEAEYLVCFSDIFSKPKQKVRLNKNTGGDTNFA